MSHLAHIEKEKEVGLWRKRRTRTRTKRRTRRKSRMRLKRRTHKEGGENMNQMTTYLIGFSIKLVIKGNRTSWSRSLFIVCAIISLA